MYAAYNSTRDLRSSKIATEYLKDTEFMLKLKERLKAQKLKQKEKEKYKTFTLSTATKIFV